MAPTLHHQSRHNFVVADLTKSHCDAIAVPVQGDCLTRDRQGRLGSSSAAFWAKFWFFFHLSGFGLDQASVTEP